MIKKITVLFFILMVLSLAYNLVRQISGTTGSSDRLGQMIEEVQKLEAKNKELRQKLEQIKSAGFIEEQARNKLGLGRDGETVVIIAENRLKEVLGASESATIIRLPNWLGWFRLFWR